MHVGSQGSDPASPVVLVVEDEVLIRLAIADHLVECGYRVLEAGTAREALDVLATPVRIDVVLTDVMMPGPTDGFGLARWIRANRPEIQVIVASGVEAQTAAANEICDRPDLLKPYDFREVSRRVETLLAARRSAT